MANSISEIKDRFTSSTLRTALNASFTAQGLVNLSGPILRHRRQLQAVSRLPALVVELGEVTGVPVGAGGLMTMRGTATCYLALGRANDEALFDAAEQYVDALRAAVESTLSGEFQRLRFSGAVIEGEAYSEAGPTVRLVPVRFDYDWLYGSGER